MSRPANRFLVPIARAFLRVTGWRAAGDAPTAKRFVLIAAPHTSSWDLVYLLAFAALYGVDVSWMGKAPIFRPPFGGIMRGLGGIPIDRKAPHGVVGQMVERFRERERLALVVPAEGTRGRTEFWKSGFYHIAREADVPVVLGFLDYAKREGGFGPAIRPTADVTADMDRIRDFYRGIQGKYPECFGPIRLREEA